MRELIIYWMSMIAKFDVMLYNEREKIIERRVNIKEAKQPK